jgi:hypothetical protein
MIRRECIVLKEVQQFDWQEFLTKVTDYYGQQGCEVEIKFNIDGDALRRYTVHNIDGSSKRELNALEAFQEIKKILFPAEPIRVISIFKKRETMFGGEQIYVAVESEQ